MRDPSRIKLEEYGWEMTEETQRGGEYYILNRHDRRALDSSPENRWAQSGLQRSKLGRVRMWIGLLLPVIGGGVHVLTAKTPLEGHPANFLLAAVSIWVVIIALAAGLLWIRDSYPYTVVANVPQGKPTGS
jgi:hypothetical protein